MAKTTTIEDSFTQLDDIIAQLESGSLSLDESFKKYNEGIKQIKTCNQQLDKVEKHISVIDSKDED